MSRVNPRRELIPREGQQQQVRQPDSAINRRRYPGCKFFITIGIDHQASVSERLTPLNNCEYFQPNNEIISFVVSCESNQKHLKFEKHLHAFIEYKLPIYIQELCEYLFSIYDNCHIHVQPCRSKKTCIIYISKEDTDLLTNETHFSPVPDQCPQRKNKNRHRETKKHYDTSVPEPTVYNIKCLDSTSSY